MNITYTKVSSDDELQQIIRLQRCNLRLTKGFETECEQGFVTVVHNFELLKEMNEQASHIIAKNGNQVVGYALAMTKDFKAKIPELAPMFEIIEPISYQNQKLSHLDFMVMGQVCIDEAYRGKGIFRALYKFYFDTYLPSQHRIITEVAFRNQRSLNAHLSIGFKEIYRYLEVGMEEWVVLLYELPLPTSSKTNHYCNV